MTALDQIVFLGIRGSVIALDRTTGEELWRVQLKGSDFVNLTLDRDQLLATAKGEIFCLDAATGAERWHNKLGGMGLGLVTVVTTASGDHSIVSEAEALRRRQQAAAGAASAGTSGAATAH